MRSLLTSLSPGTRIRRGVDCRSALSVAARTPTSCTRSSLSLLSLLIVKYHLGIFSFYFFGWILNIVLNSEFLSN